MKRLALLIALAVTTAAPAQTLKFVKGVTVLVEHSDIFDDTTLTSDEIKTCVELQLRKNGVPIAIEENAGLFNLLFSLDLLVDVCQPKIFNDLNLSPDQATAEIRANEAQIVKLAKSVDPSSVYTYYVNLTSLKLSTGGFTCNIRSEAHLSMNSPLVDGTLIAWEAGAILASSPTTIAEDVKTQLRNEADSFSNKWLAAHPHRNADKQTTSANQAARKHSAPATGKNGTTARAEDGTLSGLSQADHRGRHNLTGRKTAAAFRRYASTQPPFFRPAWHA